MEYPVKIDGFEWRKLAVTSAEMFANPKLLVDGQSASQGQKRGEFILRKNNGAKVIAQVTAAYLGFDPVPQLIIDGKTIQIMEPLKTYQWIWSGIPLFLFFIGGVFGTLCSIIAFAINVRILRSQRSNAVKYLTTALVTIASVGIYYGLPIITTPLINLIFRKS